MSAVIAAKMDNPPIQFQCEIDPEAPDIEDNNPLESNDNSNSSGSKKSKKEKGESSNEKNNDNEEVNSESIDDAMARVRPSNTLSRRRPSGSAVLPCIFQNYIDI